MCSCISITRIYLEISEQISTSGFFYPNRRLVGIRDFQPKLGWLDSLPTLPIGNPEYMYSVASISFHHVSG